MADGGGVAFASQSGSVGVESLGLASNTGFGMRAFVGLGNKVGLDEPDVIWRADRRPWHLETPPLSRPTLDGYAFPRPGSFFRPEWKERAFAACSCHGPSFLVGSLGRGLFERSWNLRGFENVLVDAVTEPDFYAEVLDRLTELYLEFVRYTVELPVDAVMFGDDWGDPRGVILGPERWRTFLKPRWARIYSVVHEAGKVVISHSCGSVAQIVQDLIDIGLDVLESVQPEAAGMNPYELKRRYGRSIAFWGGARQPERHPLRHAGPDFRRSRSPEAGDAARRRLHPGPRQATSAGDAHAERGRSRGGVRGAMNGAGLNSGGTRRRPRPRTSGPHARRCPSPTGPGARTRRSSPPRR